MNKASTYRDIMGLMWTIIASFLYIEIGLVLIFLLPFISPLTWRKCFKSRILALLSTYSYIYIKVFVVALGLAFVDSIFRLYKYTASIEKTEQNPNIMGGSMNQQQHLNLFRAQRNFYISGFSLFLWLVLNRLVTLISSHAQLMTDYEATKKQAMSATEAAQKFMNEVKNNEDNAVNKEKESQALNELQTELDDTKKNLQLISSELESTKVNLEAMKCQAEATQTEYDRLLDEYASIQANMEGNDGSKKDK